MLKCELCESTILPDPGGNPLDIDCPACNHGHLERIKDAQLICEKGHQLNEAYFSIESKNKRHCPKCGSQTIYRCPECQWEIPGNSLSDGSDPVTLEFPDIPDFCEHCGEPYPWQVYRQGILESRGMDVPPKVKAIKEDYPRTDNVVKNNKWIAPGLDFYKNNGNPSAHKSVTNEPQTPHSTSQTSTVNNTSIILGNVDHSHLQQGANNSSVIIKKNTNTKHPLLEKLYWLAGILIAGIALYPLFKPDNKPIIVSPVATPSLQQINSGSIKQPIQAEKVEINNYQINPGLPAKEKKEIKKALDKLAGFYDQGDRVKGECTDPNGQYSLEQFTNDYQSWMKVTKEYLKIDPELGTWYVVQFDKHDPKDNPGDRTPPSTAPKDRSDKYPDIIRRMENLQYFGDKLSGK